MDTYTLTITTSGETYWTSPETTEAFAKTLEKEKAERDNSLMAQCKDPLAKVQACKRIIAENASNPEFQSLSSDELRKAINKSLASFLAKTD